MGRGTKYCLLAVGVLIASVIAYAMWRLFGDHSTLLWQHSRKYAAVQHPASTQHIKRYRRVGLLIGNGNHCDLFAGELRSYTGSRRRILEHYASQSFWSPIAQERLPVEVAFVEQGALVAGHIYHGEIGYLPFPLETALKDASVAQLQGKQLYVVYIFDPGYEPGWDIRCH